jgi:hypothetical protein
MPSPDRLKAIYKGLADKAMAKNPKPITPPKGVDKYQGVVIFQGVDANEIVYAFKGQLYLKNWINGRSTWYKVGPMPLF